MKDFQDFCEYLQDSMSKNPGDVPSVAKFYNISKPSAENFAAFMQRYTQDIALFSAETAMYYLSVYHEWLEEQIP